MKKLKTAPQFLNHYMNWVWRQMEEEDQELAVKAMRSYAKYQVERQFNKSLNNLHKACKKRKDFRTEISWALENQ